MFRDTKEELERLEQQLLAEEPDAEQPEAQEEDYGDFLEEKDGEAPVVYQNFSNRYGADLRNHATGYKAYNGDTVDTDLEQFSEEVRIGEKRSGIWLPALIAVLAAGVVAYIAWTFFGGLG